jgi:Domain of unknown function (DUF397)
MYRTRTSKEWNVDTELSFQRSSYCASSCCVEVARAPRSGKVIVRSSLDAREQIEFSVEEWRAFLAGVKRNEFDV